MTGRTFSVPASRVILSWKTFIGEANFPGECDSSGLAADLDGDGPATQTRALCEVLERDALMLAWRISSWPVQRLKYDLVNGTLKRAVTRLRLRVELYDVGDVHLAPVILALVQRDSHNGLACGSSCHLDIGIAVQKAVMEALMVWIRVTSPEQKGARASRVVSSLDHVLLATGMHR